MDTNKSTIQGYLAGVLCGLTDSISTAFTQLLSGRVPPFELNLGRFGTQWIVCLVIMLIRQESFRVPPQFRVWIVVFAFFGTAHNLTYYRPTAASLVPLGNLAVVHQSVMITASALVAKFIFKDRLFWGQCPLIIMVLIGGVLVSQPEPLFRHTDEGVCRPNKSADSNMIIASPFNESRSPEVPSGMSYTLGYILTVTSAFNIVGCSWVLRVKLREISPIIAAFWYSTGGLVVSTGIIFYAEEPVYIMDYMQVLFFAGHCIGITICTLFFVVSLQLITPLAFSLIWSTGIVFNFMLQYCFGGIFLRGNRNVTEVVGAVVIACGNGLFSWWNTRLQKMMSST